jgi:acyl dehydratase
MPATGVGSWSRNKMEVAAAAPPKRKPDAVVSHATTPEQGALYRAASGEWNPMHIDPATAKKAGFPGPILSGTCTIGLGVKHVIDTYANKDSTLFHSVRLRLSKPVFPGEVARTEMWWEDDGRRIVYQQSTPDGRVVISQAVVELKKQGQQSGRL